MDLFLSAYIIDAAQCSLSKLHSYNEKSTFCHQDVCLKPKKRPPPTKEKSVRCVNVYPEALQLSAERVGKVNAAMRLL